MLLFIHLQHHYLHHVSHGHGLRGVLDEAVADLRDMHQPVLMDADIHEHAEVHHIADRPRQLHAGL